MDVICTLGYYSYAVIYSIGALTLSIVILVRVLYFCECMSMNNNESMVLLCCYDCTIF